MPSILLLGATSDMAVAIAQKFAQKGYLIQLASRNSQRLKPLQSDLAIRFNAKTSVHEFDALDFESHSLFFETLSPKPDITVSVFGYLGDQEKAEQDWKESKKIIDSNYTGCVSVLNAAAKYYARQMAGCIVGICSVAGDRGRQSNYIYGSAKAGFKAYLSGLRNRMQRYKVHVVTIQPGFVYTKMTEHLTLPKLLTAQPYDVANAVYKSVRKKKNIVYVKWFWRWIMLLIRSIPERMFKKMKL